MAMWTPSCWPTVRSGIIWKARKRWLSSSTFDSSSVRITGSLGGRTISADQIIVGIDVGTTKVCTLIADMASGMPEILGVGICPSQGLRKGVVVDVQAAVAAIES